MEFLMRQTVPVDPQALSQAQVFLHGYMQELSKTLDDFSYSKPESFISYISDKNTHSQINEVVHNLTSGKNIGTVFVVGIGGANLASKAIYDACIGYQDDVLDVSRKMVFLDTIDSSITEPILGRIQEIHSKDDFVVTIISKSGKTIETLANAEFLLSKLESRFGNITDRVVVVTEDGSPLAQDAEQKGINTFLLPHSLSDRFSAFSPTTLIPLACFGFLIEDFLQGASSMMGHLLAPDKNPSLETASSLHFYYSKGFLIYDLFFFSPRLETLGKWQRQLVAESIGKEKTNSGKEVRIGFTPMVSIGTTDLHSNLQLTLGGTRERITSFVSVKNKSEDVIGDAESVDLATDSITGVSPQVISHAILASVQESYAKDSLPYFDIVLSEISLKSIGAYMIFSMLQTVYLAKLFDVNAFDQPHVEEYKLRAREILS